MSFMRACVDVDYRTDAAVVACVLFGDWSDEHPTAEWIVHLPPAAAYEPGRFYLRELPCLLHVLEPKADRLAAIVIDGYVWLDSSGRQGLGAYLYEALAGRVAVVGVAKTAFHGAPSFATSVLRGGSRAPLYVTSAGMPLDIAAAHVRSMHGPHRLPTLLKRVDQLCRGLLTPAGAEGA